MATGVGGEIRIDQYWMAVEPIDMRAGMETVLGKVVFVFGSAQAHHAYFFTNRRANRIKVLVTDGFGVWLQYGPSQINGQNQTLK